MPPATFLQALGDDDREMLLRRCRPRDYARGDVIFRAGAQDTSFALLLSGCVKLIAHVGAARPVLVGLRGAGDVIGELAALGGVPRSVDVVSVDSVRAAVAPAGVLRQFLNERPAALMTLCLCLGDRLREADAGRVEMAALGGGVRVAIRLLRLAETYGQADGDAVRIRVPISQDELADWTGMSRQAVSRALSDLRAAGCVATARRQLSVLDLAGLRRLIDVELDT